MSVALQMKTWLTYFGLPGQRLCFCLNASDSPHRRLASCILEDSLTHRSVLIAFMVEWPLERATHFNQVPVLHPSWPLRSGLNLSRLSWPGQRLSERVCWIFPSCSGTWDCYYCDLFILGTLFQWRKRLALDWNKTITKITNRIPLKKD